jgi:VCBS repeat-containing protein
MFNRFFWLMLALLLLTACNQPALNAPQNNPAEENPGTENPGNNPSTSLNVVSDSYTFRHGALSLVAKENGILSNDTLPQTFELTVSVNPEHGTLELNPDGSFSYQHDGSEASEDSFSYTVSSAGEQSSATVTLTITAKPLNAPTANADTFTLDEGATLTVNVADGVLKNDTNPLASSLTSTVLETPKHGNFTLNTDGSFTYTHDHSETSEDSFIYTVSNGQETAQATVIFTIRPVMDAPVISKLELAQTHVIPAEGKSWAGDKLKDYNLHLVGNRDALVLVDISSANGRVVDAFIEAYIAGQKLGEVALNASDTLPKTESNGPAYSSTAYWANLDKSWITPGLELKVRANEEQYSETKAVKVGAPGEFTMYSLPFYLFGLDETDIPLSQTAAPDKITQDEYFAKHPFATLNMLNHPAGKIVWPYIIVAPRQGRVAQKVEYKEQQGDGYAVMSAILNTLGVMQSANGDSSMNSQYYAPLLMANQAGNYSHPGGGLGGGNVGTGDYSYTGIFIHEAGHAYGMPHANDGYTAGTYPYIGGSLKGSSWGFDQTRNEFLGTFVPTSSTRYASCALSSFPMGRQFDEQNRCIKQDPMQSGSGDEAKGYKYTMFSDFNASVVQQYLEGVASNDSSGKRVYSGGRVFLDKSSATGYSRWDSLDSKYVPFEVKTTSGGIYGLDNGLPILRDVPVHTIIVTIGIDSIQNTATEDVSKTRLTYQDTVNYNPTVTQIYPPVSYSGNLRRTIDPTDATQRTSITPNTSKENYWYCLNSGCDYTLRVTFSDDSQQHVALQGGFKGWYGYDIIQGAANPASSDSYRVFGVNVPGNKTIKKLELLETPEVWKGFPASPKVIATRTLN